MEWQVYGALLHSLLVGLLKVLEIGALGACTCLALDRLILILNWAQMEARSWLTGQTTIASNKGSPMPDPDHFANLYPRVAVQLPMFNEYELCQDILDIVCSMHWPKNRFIVQVPFLG